VQRLPPSRGSLGCGKCASDSSCGGGGGQGGCKDNCGGEQSCEGGLREQEADSAGPSITSMHWFFGQATVAQVIASVGINLFVERNGASITETSYCWGERGGGVGRRHTINVVQKLRFSWLFRCPTFYNSGGNHAIYQSQQRSCLPDWCCKKYARISWSRMQKALSSRKHNTDTKKGGQPIQPICFQVLLRHKVCDWLLAAEDGLVWAYPNPAFSAEVTEHNNPMLISWSQIVTSFGHTKGCNAASSGGNGCYRGNEGGSGNGSGGSKWCVEWPRRKSAARMLEKALRAYESNAAEIADAARMGAAFETAAGLARFNQSLIPLPFPRSTLFPTSHNNGPHRAAKPIPVNETSGRKMTE
jgi:hypothetical protein